MSPVDPECIARHRFRLLGSPASGIGRGGRSPGASASPPAGPRGISRRDLPRGWPSPRNSRTGANSSQSSRLTLTNVVQPLEVHGLNPREFPARVELREVLGKPRVRVAAQPTPRPSRSRVLRIRPSRRPTARGSAGRSGHDSHDRRVASIRRRPVVLPGRGVERRGEERPPATVAQPAAQVGPRRIVAPKAELQAQLRGEGPGRSRPSPPGGDPRRSSAPPVPRSAASATRGDRNPRAC